DVPADKLRRAIAVRAQLTPLPPRWIALCEFAADYYQRPLGEVALPALPKNLRVETTVSLDRALKKLAKQAADHDASPVARPALNAAQQDLVEAIAGGRRFLPVLLFGVTGSGKTEVYLQASARLLAEENPSQILILVPKINLTPQLEANVRARFPG